MYITHFFPTLCRFFNLELFSIADSFYFKKRLAVELGETQRTVGGQLEKGGLRECRPGLEMTHGTASTWRYSTALYPIVMGRAGAAPRLAARSLLTPGVTSTLPKPLIHHFFFGKPVATPGGGGRFLFKTPGGGEVPPHPRSPARGPLGDPPPKTGRSRGVSQNLKKKPGGICRFR